MKINNKGHTMENNTAQQLWFSQEAAHKLGYLVATLKDGQEVNYTCINSNFENDPANKIYKWEDKILITTIDSKDIVSIVRREDTQAAKMHKNTYDAAQESIRSMTHNYEDWGGKSNYMSTYNDFASKLSSQIVANTITEAISPIYTREEIEKPNPTPELSPETINRINDKLAIIREKFQPEGTVNNVSNKPK